jgi:hypothetical protein
MGRPLYSSVRKTGYDVLQNGKAVKNLMSFCLNTIEFLNIYLYWSGWSVLVINYLRQCSH